MSTELWMPLHVGKYLLDTHELNLAQHGAYLLLLMHYWQTGAPLSDDDCKLCRIVGVSLREWKKALAPALRPFFTERDGKLHQKRADIELARAADISGKRRAAALASHHRPTTGGGGGNGVDHDAIASASAVDNSANAPANASANGVSKAANAPALAPHTVHLPSKNNTYLGKEAAGARASALGTTGDADGTVVNLLAAKAVADVAKLVGQAVRAKAPLGFRRDQHEQMAHICDPPGYPKPRYLSREQLAMANPARRRFA